MIENDKRGLTFIEVLLVAAAGALVLTALFALAVRVAGISRFQIEQGRIVEEAKAEMDRMSDAIRNAGNVDFDDDGQFSGEAERWLRRAGPGEIVIYTNADDDSEPEMVQYWVDGDKLMRRVTEMGGTGTESPQVLARGFRNAAQAKPLLVYYSLGGAGAQAVDPAYDLKAVDRVEITFLVDADEDQDPPAAVIKTQVTPRRGRLRDTAAGSAPPLPPAAPAFP